MDLADPIFSCNESFFTEKFKAIKLSKIEKVWEQIIKNVFKTLMMDGLKVLRKYCNEVFQFKACPKALPI